MPRRKAGNPNGFVPKHDYIPTAGELGQAGIPIDDPVDDMKRILGRIDEGLNKIKEDSIPPCIRAVPGHNGRPPLEDNEVQPRAKTVMQIAKEKRAERLAKQREAIEDSKGKALVVIPEDTPPGIPLDKIRVTFMKDTTLMYPDLFIDVFVVGDKYEQQQFASMFVKARCKKAATLEDADLVIFTGGEDVDPSLYGEEKHSTTRFLKSRDDDDMAAYVKCLTLGLPMLGICRGAQFLHVMNGGKLYQHVDNHNGEHEIWDVVGSKRITKVSSVHHQAVIPNNNGFQLLATANVSRNRWRNPRVNDMGTKIDVEAFFYRDTCCIGIQGHPEYRGYDYFAKWVLDLVDDLVMINPDVEWRKSSTKPSNNRRLKEDFIAERDARLKSRNGALV